MKTYSVDHIKNSGDFRLVKELRFSEILKFVLENIILINRVTIFFLIINLIFSGLFASLIAQSIIETGFTFQTVTNLLPPLMWGTMAGSIFIIPFHEGLHGIAFKFMGAKKVRFGADLQQFICYAVAADFVAGKKAFTFIALLPFVVINLACIPILLMGGKDEYLFVTCLLLLHNLMCIGDFGMLSYLIKNKDKEMFTFDDLETKTSWFYERIKE
jgi:hypothetical protein